MNVLESPLVAALNHVLQAEPWARERLAPFCGEVVEIAAGPLPVLRLAIVADGLVAAADKGSVPGLRIVMRSDALAALAKGEEHFLRSVELNGNARLASEVLFLARHLRWDVEEDVSRVVGDVAAHRAIGLARQICQWQIDSLGRLTRGAVDFLSGEAGLLASGTHVLDLAAAASELRDGLDRLEKRIERLERN